MVYQRYTNIKYLITPEWFFRIIIKSVPTDTDLIMRYGYNKTIVNDRVVLYSLIQHGAIYWGIPVKVAPLICGPL